MNLNIATGEREYNVNDSCTLRFNPTDPNFIERIYKTLEDLDEKDEKLHELVQAEKDSKRVFEIHDQMDKDMRARIDSVLGDGVCDKIFGGLSMYAQADGLPLWANLLLAIVDEMDTAFSKEKKDANPRLKKYTEKFNKAKKG